MMFARRVDLDFFGVVLSAIKILDSGKDLLLLLLRFTVFFSVFFVLFGGFF